MAEWWINTTGTTWKQVTEAYVNTGGTTWKEITEGWVCTGGTTWKQFYANTAPDPSFTAWAFLSDVDVDEGGTGDNEGCSPCSSVNGWCIKYSVADCTASHQVTVQRSIGGSFFDDGTSSAGCTRPQAVGWCTSSGYSGAIDSGDLGTPTCPSVGNSMRLLLENSGGGGNYGYAPDSSGWTIATCVGA